MSILDKAKIGDSVQVNLELSKDRLTKETIDALSDILYVVYGAGASFGIDLDKTFDMVHESNMSKVCKNEDEAENNLEENKKGEEDDGSKDLLERHQERVEEVNEEKSPDTEEKDSNTKSKDDDFSENKKNESELETKEVSTNDDSKKDESKGDLTSENKKVIKEDSKDNEVSN